MRRLAIAVVLVSCDGAGDERMECRDLDEGACLVRDDCVPFYRYGGCPDCPAVFEGCRVTDGETCAGAAEWTCGEEPPACATEYCVPAAEDPCLAIIDTNECLAASCRPAGYLACDGRCQVAVCLPPGARDPCERLDPETSDECARRPDCAIRAVCQTRVEPEVVCDLFCHAPCLDDDDCDPYEACRDVGGVGVPTCEMDEGTCEASDHCFRF